MSSELNTQSRDNSFGDPRNMLRSSSGGSSLQPSMNPGSFGNPAKIAILEENKESSGDEFEERKRGL